ncbi:MAG TPA: hypothetical protein VFD71_00425 [Planctomycetota bacterium]|jgi:hypothetical protein|nr:hypothetical protein [Planctomycetota bacterium]
MQYPGVAAAERPSAWRLGGAMLLISFATVLFTLGVWKLLAFFIMPSLFFDLLFVGFPAGAFLGVKFVRISLRGFLRTLWILQGAMVLSVAACLVCKHADYLRAHLFEVRILKLLGQMGAFTVLFLPFFCAYGLSEYVGYQLGDRQLGGRMRLVYGLYLFGAAAAYLVIQPALREVGVTGVLGGSLLLTLAASGILTDRRRERTIVGAICLAIALAFTVLPGASTLEAGFLDLYKGSSMHSTQAYAQNGYRLRFERWGKYSLTEIMSSAGGGQFAGFYNDFMQWEYTPGTGYSSRMLGAIPIHITPRGSRIAIIGSGGGRQVKWALQPRYQFEEILALELEPAVLEAVRKDLKEEFDSVYEAPVVRALCREARGYMQESKESFDLIFMPSVGGYPQMMLEPGNMIRTFDAYAVLKERLTDRGILAIWYPTGLDPVDVLTRQYVRTLGEQGLGLKTQAYRNGDEILILAAKSPATPLPSPAEIDAFLRAPDDPSGLLPRTDTLARTLPFFVLNDPSFKPITDEQPYLAGNVRHIFSLGQLWVLFGLVAAILAFAGVFMFVALRRTGDPGIPGRSYTQVAGLSLLIGANFVLFEHYLCLALFKKLFVFQDALALGAVSFLVLSGLGSLLVRDSARRIVQGIALICLLPVLLFEKHLSSTMLLALILPVAFATGSFFPSVFELAIRNPIAVFAMDALGAALGSATSFFLPIAFGFSAFFPIAAAVFVATSILTWLFTRPGVERSPSIVPAAAGAS